MTTFGSLSLCLGSGPSLEAFQKSTSPLTPTLEGTAADVSLPFHQGYDDPFLKP